jgi:1,4-dihydroxy-2-naphthoyl-CoA synthase
MPRPTVASTASRLAREAAQAIAKRAREIADEIGRSYTMNMTLPDEDSLHLHWFNAGVPDTRQPARPVLRVQERVRKAAIDAIIAKTARNLAEGRALGLQQAFIVGGNAIRAVYVDRLTNSGGDMKLAALSPDYFKYKQRKGLDLRIGVARGYLLAAMRRSLVIMYRTK